MEKDADSKKLYGLLGKKINYSLSPIMHNAAFRHFNIPAEYKIFDIEEKNLERFFTDIVLSRKVNGINVTVPYKIRIKEFLEKREDASIEKVAKILGAINTLKVEPESIEAFNTDGGGFYESLLEDAGYHPRGKDIFIIGAGGAGRAISLYLAMLGNDRPKRINVYDTDDEKMNTLKEIFEANFTEEILFEVDPDDIPEKFRECDLVVNATPLGINAEDPLPIAEKYLREGMVLYDLVYAKETRLVSVARRKGLTAIGGLGMLVNQGALAFNIWTGSSLEETKIVMKRAIKEALEKI